METWPRPLSAYRHVIWDWNGTLVDDVALCVRVLNELLAEHQLPALDLDRYRAHFDFPVIHFYRHLGFDTAGESFESISTRFIELYHRYADSCGLYPQVPEVLQMLADSGLGQSILSASHQEHLEAAVEHYGVRGFFSGLYGIDTIHAPGKRERGREALRHLGLPPEDVLLIGDTLHDAAVAQDLGIDCVLVTCGHHGQERLLASRAPLLGCPGELLRYGEVHGRSA